MARSSPDFSADDAFVSGTADPMSWAVLKVIQSRRSNPHMRADAPTRAEVESLLEAASLAPNHGLTIPWRFFVLRGDARRHVGEALGEDIVAHHQITREAAIQAARERAMHKLLRAPITIVVAAVPPNPARFPFWEEIAATAAAVQNLLLAAQARGLAAHWRSDGTSLAQVKRVLGLAADAQIVGFINLGHPDPIARPAEKHRPPAATVTTWLGWDTADDQPSPASPSD